MYLCAQTIFKNSFPQCLDGREVVDSFIKIPIGVSYSLL